MYPNQAAPLGVKPDAAPDRAVSVETQVGNGMRPSFLNVLDTINLHLLAR